MDIYTDQMTTYLEGMNPLREPTMRAAIEALQLPRGSRGLDIGCGIGDLAALLSDAIGLDGHVTGLDISLPLLDYAHQRISRSAMVNRIAFLQGDMQALPCAQGSYDWVWSTDCVGYPAGELLPLLKGICRLVRPGGVVALLGWTSQQLLPGHEMLEARLNANCSPYASFLEDQLPRAHFQRALHWFNQAELADATCRTFIGSVHAPLQPEIRHAMGLLFEMLWSGSISQASKQDSEEYHRLCLPSSPDFIVDIPEYYGFFIYTMFSGRVTG